MSFYIFHRHRVCLMDLHLAQLVGRLWVFFLSHTAPGFHLWFYFHLSMWMVHWSLLLGLPWRIGFAPVRARCGGGAAAWVAEVLAVPGTEGSWQLRKKEIQCSKGAWQPVLANTLQYSYLDNTSSWQRKHGSPLSAGSKRVGHNQSNPVCINAKCFCLWQLCPSESWAWRWWSYLTCRDPGGWLAGTQPASTAGAMAL